MCRYVDSIAEGTKILKREFARQHEKAFSFTVAPCREQPPQAV